MTMTKAETLAELLTHNRSVKRTITYLETETSERVVSYGELYDRALGILFHLQKLGARPGDKLIIYLANNEQFLDAFWAGMLGGIAAAGALGLVVGVVILGRRLEAEYFAILTLVIVIAMSTLLSGQPNLFNGVEGLINIPQPFGASLSSTSYGTWYLLMVAAFAVVV